MATNSARQRSNDPKSRTIASFRAPRGFALRAQSIKEEFVQDHRTRDQLIALKSVDQKAGRFVEFELRELLVDEIEALNGAAVVILVVADDQPLRHALDPTGIAGQRFHGVRHDKLPALSSP